MPYSTIDFYSFEHSPNMTFIYAICYVRVLVWLISFRLIFHVFVYTQHRFHQISCRNDLRYFSSNKDSQLKLPIHRSVIDIGCDQGYGSERSPEDELPPPIPLLATNQASNQHISFDFKNLNGCEYGFITNGI